jgi:hypothetical protein
MMQTKAVLDGLWPLECVRKSGFDFLPIPYKEELIMAMGAITKAKNLTPLGKVELIVSVQSCGTPEQFNVHAQQAITAIKQ